MCFFPLHFTSLILVVEMPVTDNSGDFGDVDGDFDDVDGDFGDVDGDVDDDVTCTNNGLVFVRFSRTVVRFIN